MATVGPRLDYLQKHDYFMAVALLAAKRSRDPDTQVGACIVKNEEVIAVGYNHMPTGDEKNTWARKEPNGDEKYLYICFAVSHAIKNAKGANLRDATVYTTLFPSHMCAMEIIHAGITSVVYLSDTYAAKPFCKAAKKMLNDSNVHYERFYAERRYQREDILLQFPMIDQSHALSTGTHPPSTSSNAPPPPASTPPTADDEMLTPSPAKKKK